MNVEIQNTPDQNIVNFFPDQPIYTQGSAEFFDRKSLHKSPFAEQIFDIGGISSIFITNDMISVTKNDDAVWDEITPLILAEIMDFLSINSSETVSESYSQEDAETVKSIIALLNARIRPAVKRDGGDIKFISFNDGIVTVEMQGSCKGCPYAMRTLKDGVEKILKSYISSVKEVRSSEMTK